MERPDLSNFLLVAIVGTTAVFIGSYFILLPFLPIDFQTPGSPTLYVFGVFGALLLLSPAWFSFVKRTGLSASPPLWFVVHVIASCMGAVLIAAHSSGHFSRPPALLLLLMVTLIVFGTWARVSISKNIASTFGSKHQNFGRHNKDNKDALRKLINHKSMVLSRLDPSADEATFSVTLRHWFKSPWLSRRYVQLAREETRLIGTRRAVHPRQAYWRFAHMVMAWLFIGGIFVHVVTVTFFAGYVADGGPINWWHVTAW